MSKMEWPRLLSAKRLGKDKEPVYDPSRSPFQQDFDRIIFSTAFRRLQDKTQVFPLADNDFVHTRLTHSLETSCVGRSLGTAVGHALKDRIGSVHPSDIGAIVAAACLAHDIGNPPFGHSGEDAIRHWFQGWQEKASFLTPAQKEDISRYEGNAQGFRLLTRLQMVIDKGGLQLTHATLGAFTKYPGVSLPENKGPWSKKFGYFQAEAPFFDEIAANLGLLKRDGNWCRHPLVFLVEAADDLCYGLVDLEDGFRLNYVTHQETFDLLSATIGNPKTTDNALKIEDKKNRIEFLRAKAISAVIDQVRDRFLEAEDEILTGTLTQALTKQIPAQSALKEIQNISSSQIYRARDVIEIEAAGFEVLGGLLNAFAAAALTPPTDKKDHNTKLLQLVPKQFLDKATPYEQLLSILDFVSGMTDSYAVGLYKKIKGISLPGS
ncbi:MAG: deoxyguanosinetriphosphate triphosphohydrolase [Verrucomicrobium sp.]|nr:deoxyguanosinetriphosphate triphosphohydrolase [Verrucomicrobium sp.]